MSNRASFLAVAAIATLSLAAASPSHAGGSGGDKSKNGQTFKQSSNGSNNTASNSGNSNHKDGCCSGDHHRRHHEKFIVINRYPSYSYPSRPQVVQVPRPTYVAPALAPSCLTKEYLQNSTVMFKDNCTKEWAMNSTTLTAQPVGQPGVPGEGISAERRRSVQGYLHQRVGEEPRSSRPRVPTLRRPR